VKPDFETARLAAFPAGGGNVDGAVLAQSVIYFIVHLSLQG
jgi:hypothetical protein